jgi:glucose/arabinose dehydrogenase
VAERRSFGVVIGRCLTRTLAVLFAVGCLYGSAPASAQTLVPVGGTFTNPVYLTAPPGDGRRLMVVEQGGTVRVIRDGVTLSTPFLTMDSNFTSGGERGLLSIAFRPDYERSRLLYAYYTDADGDIRVDEFRRAADSRDHVEPGYRRPVIEVLHREAGNHNGGTARFGPDGFLYMATGDGGNGYDEPNRDAHDPTSLLGKLLRIAPTPGGGYAIPPGNPYVGTGDPGRDEIWSIGLRNPYRFSFDRLNGDLFIGDVGQNVVEEINHLPAVSTGAGRGANFGWDDCEGNLAAEPTTGTAPCGLTGDIRPELAQTHSNGFCSVIGGVVVRDPSVPELTGRYLYGDLCKPALRSYVPGMPATDREETALAVSSLVGIGEDACGRVYAVQFGGTVGRLVGSRAGTCDLRVPEAGPGSGGPGGGASAPPRSTTLRVTLGGPRHQRLGRRGLLVRVRCSQTCRIRALGALTLKRGRTPIRLRQVVRPLPPNRSVSVRLRVSSRSRSAVHRALIRHRRVSARIIVRARDVRGNLRVARRTVSLRL